MTSTPQPLDLPAIGARLRTLVHALNHDLRSFSALAGVAYSTFRSYASGERPPSPELLATLLRLFDASPIWLLTGMGTMLQSDMATGQTDARASEGQFIALPGLEPGVSGMHLREEAAHYGAAPGMSVSRAWIAKRGLAAEHLVTIQMRGPAMEPALRDGETIVIDRNEARPSSGLTYAIQQDAELIVRSCQMLPGGRIRLIAANPTFQPYDIDAADPHVQFIGRVVASLHDW